MSRFTEWFSPHCTRNAAPRTPCSCALLCVCSVCTWCGCRRDCRLMYVLTYVCDAPDRFGACRLPHVELPPHALRPKPRRIRHRITLTSSSRKTCWQLGAPVYFQQWKVPRSGRRRMPNGNLPTPSSSPARPSCVSTTASRTSSSGAAQAATS